MTLCDTLAFFHRLAGEAGALREITKHFRQLIQHETQKRNL
jgi:hypothetical protein